MSHSWQHFREFISGLSIWQWWSPAGLVMATPPLVWKMMDAYITFLVVLLVVGMTVPFLKNFPTRAKGPLISLCWSNLVLGLILFFFRYQGIPLLGMDLWRFIQESAIVIWLFFIFRTYKKDFGKDTFQAQVEAYRTKYLPKPKAKKVS